MQARRAVFSHIEADPHIPTDEEERDGPPQPAPALRFSCDVCLLPFNHPIRLAEDLAVLDNISNGRVEVGIGAGSKGRSTCVPTCVPIRFPEPYSATGHPARRLERNRKFVDSPLEGDGFELLVPPRRNSLGRDVVSAHGSTSSKRH
jgi:hypothetical protein